VALSRPVAIAAGPDGNLWFTEVDASRIGQISTAGMMLMEFAVSTEGQGARSRAARSG
jgi:virginiamycin B lyase